MVEEVGRTAFPWASSVHRMASSVGIRAVVAVAGVAVRGVVAALRVEVEREVVVQEAAATVVAARALVASVEPVGVGVACEAGYWALQGERLEEGAMVEEATVGEG